MGPAASVLLQLLLLLPPLSSRIDAHALLVGGALTLRAGIS